MAIRPVGATRASDPRAASVVGCCPITEALNARTLPSLQASRRQLTRTKYPSSS